jgi:hypothetical protein
LFEAISAIGHPGNKEVVAQKEKEDEPF